MTETSQEIFLCSHCGNRTPHSRVFEYTGSLLYEMIDRPYYEPFSFHSYVCGTCSGLSLLGCFDHEKPERDSDSPPMPRLYPKGPDIDPPSHTVSGGNPIPSSVRRAFREAWPLRYTAPAAFANQIRRTLEFICEDQHADGNTLHKQLEDLASKGVFPGELADIATLVRMLGNIGSHASDKEVSIWDAELLDALFRMLLEYVYLGPARVKRLKERMSSS